MHEQTIEVPEANPSCPPDGRRRDATLALAFRGPGLSAASNCADALPGVDRMGGRMRSWPRSTRLPSSSPRGSLGRQTILRHGHVRGVLIVATINTLFDEIVDLEDGLTRLARTYAAAVATPRYSGSAGS